VNTKTPLRIFSAFAIYVALLGTASASKTNMETLGDNTYAITREASTTFDRNVEKLKAAAQEDAAKFAAAQGKELKIIAVTSDRPFYTLGFAKARIVFKLFKAGDPELTAPAAAPTPLQPGVITTTGGDDLYTELLKLDDLHKRGILTDSEFNSEKKKVLKRSK